MDRRPLLGNEEARPLEYGSRELEMGTTGAAKGHAASLADYEGAAAAGGVAGMFEPDYGEQVSLAVEYGPLYAPGLTQKTAAFSDSYDTYVHAAQLPPVSAASSQPPEGKGASMSAIEVSASSADSSRMTWGCKIPASE